MTSDGSGRPHDSGPPAGGPDEPARAAAGQADGEGLAQNSGLLHVAFNAALMATFAFLYVAAGDLPDSRWEPLGSGAFPRIVLVALMVLNALLIVTHFGQMRAEIGAHGRGLGRIAAASLRSSYLVIGSYALFGAFVLSIFYLGFVLSAFWFLLVLQLCLSPRTIRSVAIALAVSAVTAFGVNFIFETYFNVFLPGGTIWRG